MRFYTVVLLFLLYQTCSSIKMSEPTLTVLRPKGLLVTVPDSSSMSKFVFHGRVNGPISSREKGELWLQGRRIGDKWVAKDEDVRLKVGDKIFFWTFVRMGSFGYKLTDRYFVVQELVDESRNEVTWSNPEDPNLTPQEVIPQEPPPPRTTTRAPPPTRPPIEEDIDLMTCQRTIIKLTPKLFKLEEELEAERERTKILIGVLDRVPGGKKLTLKGRISQTDEPIEVVNFILSQKLKLKPLVEKSVRNSDMSISFELAYVEDLVNVLQEARNRLTPTSSVSISF